MNLGKQPEKPPKLSFIKIAKMASEGGKLVK